LVSGDERAAEKAKAAGAVLTACLRNAAAVAKRAAELAGDRPIGVIAGGERWGVTAGPLRPCVEDYLGAGAVVGALLAVGVEQPSPEAMTAATAAEHVDLRAVVGDCSSARELVERGDQNDVVLATEIAVSDTAPVLVDGVFG
jgi:2-phosphosulfolactate phosphatase